MAVSAYNDGTLSAVIGTESDVCDVSATGVYSFHVDTVNMAAGDVLELRAYQTVLSGGTKRVAFFQQFYGAQLTDDLIKVSVPIGNDLTGATSLSFTIKQTYGTGRNFPWKVLQYV
jgi:hypothetical protein